MDNTEIVKRERQLVAGKGIGGLKLAVEEESGKSELMYSVVTIKQKVFISGGKRQFFFLLLEYDFYLLNWIRVGFTPQIQINKQTKIEDYV